MGIQIPQNAEGTTLENVSVTTPTHSGVYPTRRIAWLRVPWTGNHSEILQWGYRYHRMQGGPLGTRNHSNPLTRGISEADCMVTCSVVKQPFQVPVIPQNVGRGHVKQGGSLVTRNHSNPLTRVINEADCMVTCPVVKQPFRVPAIGRPIP
jgi:hypothetical protein